jgi:hypothetical protein
VLGERKFPNIAIPWQNNSVPGPKLNPLRGGV